VRLRADYDAEGRLAALRDGDGRETRITRTSDGTPTALVAPLGQTTTVAVDAAGWLARLTGPGGQMTTLTTTADGLLTGLVDANGHPRTFAYDAAGRLVRDTAPEDASQVLTRVDTETGWETTRRSPLDRTRQYATVVLQTGAQQLTVTEPDGTVATSTRRVDGSVEAVSVDGTQTTTVVGPDPRFGLQAPVPAHVTMTTPEGLTPVSETTRTAVFGSPQDLATMQTQTETTTVNGRTSTTVFDGATRTFTSTSAAGRTSTSTIDAQGRVTRTQVGALTPVDFTYDAQGRLTHITQGARASAIAYDGAGRPLALTDALARTVQFGYDAADRVITQTLPDTRTIGFGYDAGGNVTSLTPPGRPAHAFTYTPVDLTASYTPPTVTGAGGTGYLFNADKQPTAIQRPDGQATSFGYDTGGRLSAVTFSRGVLGYTYDTAGRVATLADPGGVGLTFAYDGALPLGEAWSGPITGAVTRTFSNDFDVSTEKVNDAFEVAFGYDPDRLLTQAGALTIGRDAATGLVTGTTLGTTAEAHAYNAFGESTRQTAQANGAQVFDAQITRDALGRITQRIEVVDGITRVFTYGYNLAGRLTAVERNGTLVVQYTYDTNGNRLDASGEAGLVTATYDDQDRLLTYGPTSYTYTANGELATKTTAGQTTSYAYDTLGNLIAVTKPNGQVITYTVDGRGRRVRKAIDGVPVRGWLYADQLRPIAELDGTGAVVSRFVYGTRPNVPEYVVKNGETYRIVSDHLGTPRVVVHATTGVVVQRLDVQAFGEIIQDSAPGWQPFGFAGGLYDPDTGLLRFGARDYDPQAGRWTSKDPILFEGYDMNRQGYVQNDPVNSTDATGLAPDEACDGSSTRKCFEQNRFSALFSEGASRDAVEFLEIASAVSFAGDAVATVAKSRRTGIGGRTQPYGGGMNAVFRRIGRLAGSSRLTGALVTVGDTLTPPLAVVGVFTGSYNITILIQCMTGAL
jgi:RHS repeat-associated protein